jgi:periplasmic divalent cation tolerance protein
MAKAPANVRLLLVTTGSEEEAASIGRTLVTERLAACVNIVGPARSIYRWRDAVEEAREFILVIKTVARLYSRVERRVRELHSYELPEIIALGLIGGSKPYLDWIRAATGPAPSKRHTRRKPSRAA